MGVSKAFRTAGAAAVAAMTMAGAAIAAPETMLLAAASNGESGSAAHVSGNAEDMHVGVEVSLDGKNDNDKNFLYLKGDFGSQANPEPFDFTERPARGLGLIEGSGMLGTFTPRYGNVRLGFGSGARGADGLVKNSGFDVALTSQFVIGARPAFDPLSVGLSPVQTDDRAGNFGFSLGYDGFNIGARYLYGEDALSYGYRGYDVGLGYKSGNWGTALGFSGVSPEPSSIGMDLLGTESLYTVRLGAFYQISPGLTLGGRVQYHDYRLFDSRDAQNHGEFFLNTNVNF